MVCAVPDEKTTLLGRSCRRSVIQGTHLEDIGGGSVATTEAAEEEAMPGGSPSTIGAAEEEPLSATIGLPPPTTEDLAQDVPEEKITTSW